MTLRLVCSVSMKGVLFIMFSVDVEETWKGRIVTTVLIDKSLCDFFLSFVTLFLCKLLQAVVVILSLFHLSCLSRSSWWVLVTQKIYVTGDWLHEDE